MTETMEAIELLVRPAEARDRGFIYDSWLKCCEPFRDQRMRTSIYLADVRAAIGKVLLGPAMQAIATPVGDPDTILGYLIGEKGDRDIIHMAYTKGPFRKMGVLRTLFAATHIRPETCFFSTWTHKTEALRKKWPGSDYRPFFM